MADKVLHIRSRAVFDLDIRVENNILTIRGERNFEDKVNVGTHAMAATAGAR